MAATHLGTITSTLPAGSTQIDENGMTHTIVRQMSREMARDINTHIDPSSPVNVMDSTLYLRSIAIADEPGDLAQVTYTYFAPRVYPVGGIGGPGSIVGPGTTPEESAKTECDVVLEPVSILRHPRYKNRLSASDKRVLAGMIQFGPIDSEGRETRRFLSDSVVAAEVADKIEDGTISYLSPSLVVRHTDFNIRWGQEPDVGSRLGKKDNSLPQAIRGSGSFDFILAGVTISGTPDGISSVTKVYQSAPVDVDWDDDLY